MNRINLSSQPTTAQRLLALAQIYEEGQASELMNRTLDKLLAYEANLCRTQLSQLTTDIVEFETRYGLTSAGFYAQYQAGQTDDRMDYVEWASLVQIRQNLQKRLELLTEVISG